MKKFDIKRITDWLRGLGEKWATLAKKTRVVILTAAFVVLGTAIIGTVLLNRRSGEYKQIFPGMTSAEASEVYSVLQEMGVPVQIDTAQRVTVPADQWDALIFELNSRGYPRTTLSYDIFDSASGFTATDFQQREKKTQQTQDRIQATLMRVGLIEDAVVTFYVPETSNYIWDQNNQQKSTASVSILMKRGEELTPQIVSTIKHLTATSVPKLDPADVVVMDMSTGIEVSGSDEQSSTDVRQRMIELEQLYAKQLEDKARRLLAPMYGADGVTAVASVELDFDKLVTETKQYQALENGDGGGVRSHYEEDYTRTGQDAVGGLVGEENNTDVPQYPFDNDDGNGTTTDYHKLIDYDNSYILTQMEKGQGIRSASIAVVVDDNEFSNQKQTTLVQLVAKSVNLDDANVMVTNRVIGTDEPNEPNNNQTGSGGFFANLTRRQRLILLIAVALLLLLILIIVLVLLFGNKKKRKADAEQRALEQAAIEQRAEMDRAIEEHKKKIQDEAMSTVRKPEENAIAEEVRTFAEENPEITAALIRSMMKEEK